MQRIASWLCVWLLGATAAVSQEVLPDGSLAGAPPNAAAAQDGPVVGEDGTVTLDFEELSAGQTVAPDHYLDFGVRIESSADGTIIASGAGPCSGRAIQSSPFSGPVKFFRFPAGASIVSMDVGDFGPSDEDLITVVAFDASGQEIARHGQLLRGGIPTQCLRFEVNAAAIAEVRVTSTSSGPFPNSVFIDNLVFRPSRGCHQPEESCADIIARADLLSASAMSVIEARRNGQNVSLPADLPQFSRNDHLIFFKAVECRTGVSADVLKAYAYGESLGKMYYDASPHQFLDPCKLSYNLSRWFDETIWSRYYGAQDWPLLALDPLPQFRCYGESTSCGPSPAIPPRIKIPNDSPAQASQPACSRPQQPSSNGQGNANGRGNGENWQRLWPDVIPVMLGDDRPCHDRCDRYAEHCCNRTADPDCNDCSDSFGLGIAQVTFSIGEIRQEGGLIEWVNDSDADEHTVADYTPYEPARAQNDLYPFGATPDGRVPFALVPQQDRLVDIVGDPQYNLLVAAQMAIYKGLFGEGNVAKGNAARLACSVEDPDYGTILVAGPESPTPDDWEGWFFPVMQLKGGILSNTAQLNQIRAWLANGGPAPEEQQDSCFCNPPQRPITCENLLARAFVHQGIDQPDIPPPAFCRP